MYMKRHIHHSILSLSFKCRRSKKVKRDLVNTITRKSLFCSIVDVLLFLSYRLVHIKNEIKTMLMTREGQRLCCARWLLERKRAYLCTLPHCLEEKLHCFLSPYLSQKATFNFFLETYEISYCKPFPPNTAIQLGKLLTKRSNWSMSGTKYK